MTKFKGKTQAGERCRDNATYQGYCRWHIPEPNTEKVLNTECIVCCEPFSNGESSLPCGHWVHSNCVQKSADALQELRAEEGYPPIDECTCPICRTAVPDMKPKEAPPVPPLNTGTMEFDVLLTQNEMLTVYHAWEQSTQQAPLRWYIWVALSEKYPDENQDNLITAATAFEQFIRSGSIRLQSSQPDQRFVQVLNRAWRN